MDDFTITLDEPRNMESCGMEVFEGLDQLWKLVERYGRETPLTINAVDSQPVCVRTLKAVRDRTGTWKLTEETPPTSAAFEGRTVAVPLIINSKDLSGNILKLRVELATKHHSPECTAGE
jgi:hypothetical protein